MNECTEMPGVRQYGRQAVVIGAGMAGLAAARAIADYFEHVLVLERDALSMEPGPRWGTPQSWHLHGLLAGGHQALDQLFPGIGRDLVSAGAVALRINADLREEHPGLGALPQRDFGWLAYSMSRALIEFTVRRRLMQQPNVTVRPCSRVLDIIGTPDGRRVVGVRYESAGIGCESLPTDLVVDASGRGALTVALLQSLGRHLPDETAIGIELGYTTGIVAIPEDTPSDWKGLLTLPDAPESSRRGVHLRCPA